MFRTARYSLDSLLFVLRQKPLPYKLNFPSFPNICCNSQLRKKIDCMHVMQALCFNIVSKPLDYLQTTLSELSEDALSSALMLEG